MRPNFCLRGGDGGGDLLGFVTSRASARPRSSGLADDLGDPRRVARGDDGAPAALEDELGERLAEAGRAAGDEPDGRFGLRHDVSERGGGSHEVLQRQARRCVQDCVTS